MVKLFQTSSEYDYDWTKVTLAVWRKYPNPFASHVLGNDIIETKLVDGKLHTKRLFLKKNKLPKWGMGLLKSPVAYILETCVVDPNSREMTIITRNLSHRKLMLVQETQIISSIGDQTRISISARIISNSSFSLLRSQIERFGLNRFQTNVQNVMFSNPVF
jgi:hypothetical protein